MNKATEKKLKFWAINKNWGEKYHPVDRNSFIDFTIEAYKNKDDINSSKFIDIISKNTNSGYRENLGMDCYHEFLFSIDLLKSFDH